MPLHIEFSGDAPKTELRAIRALIDTLLGETAMATLSPAIPQGCITVTGSGTNETVTIPLPPAEPTGLAVHTSVTGDDGDHDEVAAMTPASQAPDGVELDKSGLPWDIRIHSSTKATTKDGNWKAKRAVDPNLVRQVEAELRQNLAAPAPASVADVPPPPPTLDPAAAFGGAAPTVAVPAPPPATDAAPQPAPMAEFARIMRIVTAKQAAGVLSTEMATALAQTLGLTDLRGLMTRPDLIPSFEALLP